jgi:ABC-type glycerol-3-phosphate transport system substrate-binding protein
MNKYEKYSQKQTFFRLILLLSILGLLTFGISSCNLPNLESVFGSNDLVPTTPPTQVAETPIPSATPVVPDVQTKSIILWVSPQFDPNSGTAAGELFSYRLDEFRSRRPQIDLQVRVKPLQGEFSLLESLRVTESAAPILKPDLVALPRSLMEEAFREGLIISLEDLNPELSEDDWFDYALDLVRVDGIAVGIPYAGDLLTLAYKSENGEEPPPNWETLLSSQKAMSFPASDLSSVVTLAYYQSLGGNLIDESGSYVLDSDIMLEVLTFYQQAQSAGVMPYWLTQFENDQQAWNSYQDRQSTLALTWSSIILGSDSANTSLAAMPTKEGKAFSYADGWVWCVVRSNPEDENIAFELTEFLTEESYLANWASTAGYLPVKPGTLSSWSDMPYYATLQQLLPAAVMVPENSLLAELGPDIRNAVVEVLKDQIEPEIALDGLVENIPSPE